MNACGCVPVAVLHRERPDLAQWLHECAMCCASVLYIVYCRDPPIQSSTKQQLGNVKWNTNILYRNDHEEQQQQIIMSRRLSVHRAHCTAHHADMSALKRTSIYYSSLSLSYAERERIGTIWKWMDSKRSVAAVVIVVILLFNSAVILLMYGKNIGATNAITMRKGNKDASQRSGWYRSQPSSAVHCSA